MISKMDSLGFKPLFKSFILRQTVITVENQANFEKIITQEKMNLFLGAGFSVHSSNREGQNLVLGDKLKELICDHFCMKQYSQKDLQFICQSLSRTKLGELNRFLRDYFYVKSYDPLYEVLISMEIANVFTTNIDNLLECLFATSNSKILHDAKLVGSAESEDIALFKLHGSVTYPFDYPLTFATEDIALKFAQEPDLFHVIASKLKALPTLFWGTNLKDPDVILSISKRYGKFPQTAQWWIVILPGDQYDIEAEEFKGSGFNIIRADTKSLLNYFAELFNKDSTLVDDSDTNATEVQSSYFDKFSYEFISKEKKTVRPISFFFKGGDPTWYDINSETIYKLSFFRRIIDKLIDYDYVLISGCPGAGKTTLLMQLFNSREIKGDKYFFSSITRESAEKLNSQCRSKGKITIFLDNLADNLDAFLILSQKGNYKIISAERDYYYEQIKYMAKIKSDAIIDISQLPEHDIQQIFNAMRKPVSSFQNGKVSLFEIVYKAWTGYQIEEKIPEMLEQLRYQGGEIYEFYVLLTYMRSTNIAASLDMLLAYYSDDNIIDYLRIFEFKNSILSLIDDSSVADERQDYWTLRSRIFSELSMKYIEGPEIAKVLSRFHKNVNRSIIYRYDCFKKKAFDADLTTTAFPILKYGKEFYASVLDKNNYWKDICYIKHQYALYLFRLGAKEDAWSVIDQAYTEANGKLYSINNTHAIILFEINIDRLTIDFKAALDTIIMSFDVLDDCLKHDGRKFFHLFTYSGNARRLHEKLKSPISHKYVEKALKHLTLISEDGEFKSHETRRRLSEEKRILNEIG